MLAAPDRNTWSGRRDHVFILTAVQTGLRLSEMTGLKREDFVSGSGAHLRLIDTDWDRAVIHVSGKSRRETALPLPQDVGDALCTYITMVRPRIDEPRLDEQKVFLGVRAPHRAQPQSPSGRHPLLLRLAGRAGTHCALPGANRPPAHRSPADAVSVRLRVGEALSRHRPSPSRPPEGSQPRTHLSPHLRDDVHAGIARRRSLPA